MSFKKRLLITLAGVVILLAVGAGLLMTFVGKSDKGLTDSDLEQLDYVNEKLDAVRSDEEYLNMEPEQQLDVMIDAINTLANEGKIDAESVLCDREELYITYEYECGVLGAETFGENDETCGGGGDSYINRTFDDLNDEEFISSEHMGSALILDALVDHDDGLDRLNSINCGQMAEKWRDQGIDTRIDYTVTLDDLAHIDRCDILMIYMHGNCLSYRSEGKVPMMKLVQKVTSETSRIWQDDLSKGRIVIHGGQYTVTPKFFKAHYSSSGSNLQGTFLFLASCYQMGSGGEYCEKWSEIIPQIGLSGMFAFHNTVGKVYAMDLADSFTSHLLSGDSGSEAYYATTMEKGLNEIEYYQLHGDEFSFKYEPGITCYRGDDDARLRFVIEADIQGDPSIPASDIVINDAGYVVFGHYEQDDSGYPYEEYDNGPEPIEWEILSQEDGRMLLISRYIIECQPYNDEYTEVTWAGSSLRQWLNDEFFYTAFSDEERARIQTVTLTNPANPYTGVDGGIDTEDKVFLLSMDEVLEYFEFEELDPNDMRNGSSSALITSITQYVADIHYAPVYGQLRTWWLRTPGEKPEEACYVVMTGVPDWWCSSYDVRATYGVRPAIWISVE